MGKVLLFLHIGIFFYITRPGSWIHRVPMDRLKREQKAVCIFTAALTCLVAFWAMTISDWWSDSGPDYQFQYEAMTDAVLDGHFYLDLEVSPELAAMENPYDSGRRAQENVPFYWDHAFYNGHYYMCRCFFCFFHLECWELRCILIRQHRFLSFSSSVECLPSFMRL